ncbi:unnamed protein product, partial [Symbiodinium necroappetens]
SGLPVEAAIEFIDVVARKTATGHLKDPSNYVCATIARGYVPQAKLPSWQGHASFEAPPPASAVMLDMDMAAAQLQSTDSMRKAEQAGIDLNQDALNALLRLPTQHASQLLEQVVEKQGTIRDLSNYVCATVARGFHPKESTGTVWSGLPNPGPRAETEVPGAKANGKGKATMENKGIELAQQTTWQPVVGGSAACWRAFTTSQRFLWLKADAQHGYELKPAPTGMEDEVANAKWNVYTLQRTLSGDFPLSPCITAVLFDFLFFGMIGLAWAVTLVTQPTFVYDNNITRMFKSYNVCIGLDSWPARPVAAAAFTLCVPVVCLTAALHAFKAHHDDGGLKLLRKACLLVGAALGNAAMTICIAVPPDDYIKCMIHTLGFAFTLFGQGIFKTGLIVEYWLLCKKHWDAGIWNRVYFVTLVSHACVLVMAVGFLIYLLQLKDYHPIIARIQGDRIPTVSEGGVTVVGAWKGSFPFTWPVAHLVEPDGSTVPITADGTGNFLMCVTFLAPIIEVLTVPRKLLSPGVSIAYAPMRNLDV